MRNNDYNILKIYLPVLLVLIFLFILATLFPPYSWGDERLKTKDERNKYIRDVGYLNDLLPIKEYDFLFSSSKKEIFVGWGFEQGKSTKKYITLERHLITEELLLNYVLCVLIAAIFLLFRKQLELIYKNKKALIIIIISVLVVIGSFIIFKSLNNIFYKKETITISTETDSYKTGYSRDRDRRSRSRERTR
jgi:hypothetical protein